MLSVHSSDPGVGPVKNITGPGVAWLPAVTPPPVDAPPSDTTDALFQFSGDCSINVNNAFTTLFPIAPVISPFPLGIHFVFMYVASAEKLGNVMLGKLIPAFFDCSELPLLSDPSLR